MNRHLVIAATCAALISPAFGQYAVYDAAVHQSVNQANREQLLQWAEHLKKAQSQLETLNEQLKQIEEIRRLAGNPLEALQALGLGELGGLDLSTVGETASALQGTISAASSLYNTAQGLYKAIPSTVDGIEIPRNLDDFKKFAAVEGNFENYVKVTEESLGKIAKLRKEREATIKKSASTEAEQREKAAKIAALNGEIASEEARIAQAKEQIHAQQILNENNEAKQRQARVEELSARAAQHKPFANDIAVKRERGFGK